MNIAGDLSADPSDAPYRKPSQARGTEKFEKILDAAHEMIQELGHDGFSLGDVAMRAGIAKGSAYHFFPNLNAVFIALVERYDRIFIGIVSEPVRASNVRTWEDIIDIHFERARAYINANPAALCLLIGPGRTWESRLADAVGDTNISKHMIETISRFFVVPATPPPEQLMHLGIQILNGFWELSVQTHGRVTDQFSRETTRAICAYVGNYWPRHLERKLPEPVDT